MNLRPTFAEIDLGAFDHNLKLIKKRVSPAAVMAVVKANAYGHGIKEIAEMARNNDISYFGVAILEEGIQLRRLQHKSPILVFGGFFENQIDSFLKYDLELTLFDWPRAVALSTRAEVMGKTARVHIKVDTGMGRVGVYWREAANFVNQAAELPRVDIVGIYTHFAASDARDKTFARMQLQRFRAVLTELENRNIHISLKHAANSGAILDMPETHFDLVRPGVMMYGYYPSQETSESLALKPAMTLKSKVIAMKEAEAGANISYGLTYKAKNATNIATVPIGYGDGYNRLLSNQGAVLIRGQRYPVVGRVCMDQIMVDVGAGKFSEGEEVILMGSQGEQEISIWELCNKLNTIPYEITCRIAERVPRVYKK